MKKFAILTILVVYLFGMNCQAKSNYNSSIKYLTLLKAREEAFKENKFILVKIESNNCNSCDKLNRLLDKNENIKNIFSIHIKAVKLNDDYQKIPPKLKYVGTPAVFLFDSKGKKMLMRLQGSEATERLEEFLSSVVYDNL